MYEKDKAPASISRWQITGTIRTESPLHIGDGRTDAILTRPCRKDFLDGAEPDYATVMTTRTGSPVIPGTSLKGALHAWACVRLGKESALITETFGSKDRGGLVTFHDAPLKVAPKVAGDFRFWCEARSTSLTPQVVIDSRTRSAKESLLYYVEYVPAGAEFEVTFTSQGDTGRQRALILYILQHAFQIAHRPATLGSESANGWGRVKWEPASYRQMNVLEWLTARQVRPWVEGLKEIGSAEKTRWLAEAAELKSTLAPQPTAESMSFRLRLDFDGAMLVNDPSRRRKGADPIGHAAIRRDSGEIYLPAHSVRGAFRAQARRIWQTVFAESEGDHFSRFEKLFGATGWRAAIEIGDFELKKGGAEYPQEFVAVDRFTGGVAGSKKFTARGIGKPVFEGTVRIRTDRLFADHGVKAGKWVWLLLAWTLRDWAEGDGFIGFGRSKGYGAFRASVSPEGGNAGGPDAELLQRILKRDPAALDSPELRLWESSLTELLNEVRTKREAA
jgi:CRISPR/Cas system CSM-associated protein Csm3 (group 7 of RAMP superfamily)